MQVSVKQNIWETKSQLMFSATLVFIWVLERSKKD